MSATNLTSHPVVKTRILILSDTHTATPSPPGHPTHAFRHPLPAADILIHCGDLTGNGTFNQHQISVSMLESHPAQLKIIIPGNHDLTLDTPYYNAHWRRHGSSTYQDPAKCRELYMGPEAQAAGIWYMEQGLRNFSLSNGAAFTVYASAWTPEFFGWAFAYERDEDRFNSQGSSRVPDWPGADIMITHGPPHGILDKTQWRNEEVGCKHLLEAVKRCRPRVHAFGHIHEGWGAVKMNWETCKADVVKCETKDAYRERGAMADLSAGSKSALHWGKETLFVNASIMTVRYDPENAPWIIDVDLPLAKPS